MRPSGSFASGTSWEQCGNILLRPSSGKVISYQPMRRSQSGRDEGCVRKLILDSDYSTASTEWQSTADTPRNILRAQFDEDGPISGTASALEEFDEATGIFCELDSETWANIADALRTQAMGAPYPASMVLAEGLLYVISDDGTICAIDDSTGEELWAFLLPSACARLKYIGSSANSLPWLSAGSLTAEETDDDRLLLWCTLGEAGRGICCLDVTDSVPTLLWAGEEFEDGSALWTHGGENTGLGLTAAAPIAATLSGSLTLVVPSGSEADGALLLYDAESGSFIAATSAVDDIPLILSPLGLTDSNGTLDQVVCCDEDGGLQFFEISGRSASSDHRIALADICGYGGFEFAFSPISSSTSRGLWLVFIAECDDGTLVASCPPDDDDLLWSSVPWRGSGYGWWRFCEGFSSPISAFVYDGLLYLLGKQNGKKTLLVIDLTPGKLKASVEVDSDTQDIAVVDGTVVLLGSDGSITSLASLTGSISASRSAILYTLVR